MKGFALGTTLKVQWAFKKPDGTAFSLSDHTFTLKYRVGRCESSSLTAVVSGDEDNILSWTFPATEQNFTGIYDLSIDIYKSGSKVCRAVYQGAFALENRLPAVSGNSAQSVVVNAAAQSVSGEEVVVLNTTTDIAYFVELVTESSASAHQDAISASDSASSASASAANAALSKTRAHEYAEFASEVKDAVEQLSPDQSGALALAAKVNALEDRMDEDIIITDYGLLIENFYDHHWINETTGVRYEDTAHEKSCTSPVRIDTTRQLVVNTMYNAYVFFYGVAMNYLGCTTSYRRKAVTVEEYPEGTVYAAFGYGTGDLLGQDNRFHASPDLVAKPAGQAGAEVHAKLGWSLYGSFLKRKGIRNVVNIYTTDTEMQIVQKLAKAWYTRDCDVVWEPGDYTFGAFHEQLYNLESENWSTAIELPLGGNCRYYMHGCKIVFNNPSTVERVYSNANGFGTHRYDDASFELYGGYIIGNNIGYCVHDEAQSGKTPYTHLYKDVKMEINPGSHAGYLTKCIGGGSGYWGDIRIENCVFLNHYTAQGKDISWHGGADTEAREGASLISLHISDSYFLNGIGLHALVENERGSAVITNCRIGTQIYKEDNNWSVTEYNNYNEGVGTLVERVNALDEQMPTKADASDLTALEGEVDDIKEVYTSSADKTIASLGTGVQTFDLSGQEVRVDAESLIDVNDGDSLADTKSRITSLEDALPNKADKASTYTKTEIDTQVDTKQLVVTDSETGECVSLYSEVDAEENNVLNLVGSEGTLIVRGLSSPILDDDATNKSYVDGAIASAIATAITAELNTEL